MELLELKNKTLELFGVDSVEKLGDALMSACTNHDIGKFRAFDKDFYWEARHPWDDSSIEAWMPLPKPYKENEK